MYDQGYRPPQPQGRRSAARSGGYAGGAPNQGASAGYAGPTGYTGGGYPLNVPPSQNSQPQGNYAGGYGAYSPADQEPPRPPQRIPAGNRYAPPRKGASAPVKKKRGGSGRPPKTPKKKKSIWGRILAVLVLAAGLTLGAMYLKTYLEVRPYDGLFADQVYVDGLHLGGMTFEEGVNAVRRQAQSREDAWQVRLTYQGQEVTVITSDLLSMETKTDAVLKEAMQKGHAGSIFDRKEAMDGLKQTPYEAYTAIPSADTQPIDQILADLESKVYRAPQDAMLLSYNPNSLSNPFTFQDETLGQHVDTAPIKEKIYQMVSKMESGDIEIELTYDQPAVTRAMLEQKVSLRARAVTPISTSSTEGRNNNIVAAFEKINANPVIKPGEIFSFNGLVGWRTEKNGFYQAIEYAYGEPVMGWGGGVCQSSTTIYIAALEAGLSITERVAHSLEVSYTTFGLDATVSMTDRRKLDLKFKNTTDSNIYVFCTVQYRASGKPYQCTVSIYGEDLGNVRYEAQIELMNTIAQEPPVEKVDKKNKYNLAPGKTKRVKGYEGRVVQTNLYKYVNNQLVETIAVDTSTLNQKPDTIYTSPLDAE